jgi:cell division septation protein DedD
VDNDFMQHQDPEDDELTRRLEAYAEARLSPELSATIRMRTRVMAAAHRSAALARADADRADADTAIAVPARADRTRRSHWRRPLTALLAAGLTLGVGVGTVAASQAGGPLYGARVWAETLTLPSGADARAQAQLERLRDRLAEAAAATAAGDLNAANAALEAYAAIVNEATEGAGEDVSAAATLETGVRSNIDVLTVLAERFETGHGQAGEAIDRAIQRAIDRSGSALDKLHGNPNVTPPAAEPSKSPKPDKTANPNKPTEVPGAASAKPQPTPKPDATTNAASTPKPDRTPRGGPPSVPPGRGGGGPQSSSEGD